MEKENILGTLPIPKLLLKFAVPSVISMLVNSIYNLVDQIFIGQGVGYLGNGATNVTFPFVTLSLAISLMISIGCAANVGLCLGRKDVDRANQILATGLTMAIAAGLAIFAVGQIFLTPMLRLFGATDAILPYAISYARIYLFGIPMTTVGIMLGDAIRNDGSPAYTMRSMLIGAVINIIFDPIFIFICKWGVAGAALATIMGQFATMVLNLLYLRKLKSLDFKKENMGLKPEFVKLICSLGFSSFVTQSAMLVMNIVMNQQAIKYGGLSKYGADIPITVFGIVMKINQIMMSIIIGTTSGSQPIYSFNFGAGKLDRVKKTVVTSVAATTLVGLCGMAVLQSFPQQIINIFGQENDLYNEFAVMCLRNMTFFIFVMGIQMTASVFFQATGKPGKATVISLSRQILFMIPCLYILPVFFGIKGIMWSFPVSDVFSVVLSAVMLLAELKLLDKKD